MSGLEARIHQGRYDSKNDLLNLRCRIPDDHKDAYETGLAENRTSPS